MSVSDFCPRPAVVGRGTGVVVGNVELITTRHGGIQMRGMGKASLTGICSLGRTVARRRRVAVLGAALVVFLSFSVAGAFADAGNPVLNTIKSTAVDNHNGM